MTGILFVLTYLRWLPLHSQFTVRYLTPLIPLGVYRIVRLGAVRAVLRSKPRWVAGSVGGCLVVGAAVMLFVNWQLRLAIGEAMQFHALVNLGSAVLASAWASIDALVDGFDDRTEAFVLGIPAGLTTLFLLFTGLGYFQYGDYALPVSGDIANLLPVAA